MNALQQIRGTWGKELDLEKFKFMLKHAGKSVLDVGCGLGAYTRAFKKHGKFVVGVDNDKELILQARRKNGAIYKVASIYNLPFKSNSFDTVVCSDILEHLEDDLKGLKEAARVCRKNVIVTVPSSHVPKIFQLIGVTWCSREDPTHVRYYDEEMLKKLFKNAGLKYKIYRWYPSRNVLIRIIKFVLKSLGIFPDYLVIGYK
jgi:ubiquinone/menaquinone biosynthesis C-methylase UbiE